MHLGIKKEHFMYPTKAPEYKFNTPDVKKRKALQKRLKSDASFMNDVWKMRVGLATGRGRRPSRQKMSKRDLRIMGMIAQETVRLINLQEAIDPAGAKQNREKRAYIARQAEIMESRQPAASTKAGDICSAMSGAPDKSSQ